MKIDFLSSFAEVARENFTPPGYFNEMDFRESYSHIFTLKKRVRKFLESGEINERMMLNDVVILTNNFRLKFLIDFISERFTDDELSVINSLMLFLGVDFCDPERRHPVVDDILSHLRERFDLPTAYHMP